MKVLLDEDLPHDLRFDLPLHDVFTVRYMGWNGLKNGVLLQTAEEAGFEVLLTGDQSLTYQQNPKVWKIAFVVLSRQDLPALQRHLSKINSAITNATPGSVQFLVCNY